MAGSNHHQSFPDTLYLVPGFLSPRWMLLPLTYHLKKVHANVKAWDYPRVFADLNSNIDTLSMLLEREAASGQTVGIITHSFGDWIARQAYAQLVDASVRRWIAICPVIREVPAAQIAHRLVGARPPEIAVMANSERASANEIISDTVKHTTIWARWEWLVKSKPEMFVRRVTGTHNSVLFQPNLWRLVESELRLSTNPSVRCQESIA